MAADIQKLDLVDIELNNGNVHRSWMKHSIGLTDVKANAFGVRVFRDGEPVTLTTISVQGYFRDPQGNNIAITSGNTVSGNVAYVVLPAACYNYEGQFVLAIKLVGGGITGTVRIVDGMVDNTHTGGAITPAPSVATYDEVLAGFTQAMAVIEASVRYDISQSSKTATEKAQARANIEVAKESDTVRYDTDQSTKTALEEAQARKNIEAADVVDIAPVFNTSGKSLLAGDLVLDPVYNTLYKLKGNVAAGTTWNTNLADKTTLAGELKSEVSSVKSALSELDEVVRGEANYIKGYYLTSSDELVANSNYNVSEYISIDSGGCSFYYGTYDATAIRLIAYNSSKVKLDYWGGTSGAQYRTITLPANTAYVRFVFNKGYEGKVMRGSAVKWTAGYIGGLADDLEEAETDIAENTNNIETITENKLISYKPDINSLTYGYVDKNGNINTEPSSDAWFCNKITVQSGDVVTRTSGKNFRLIAAYNGDTVVSASGAENTASYTVPDGINGIIITISGASTQQIAQSQFNEVRYSRTAYCIKMDDTFTNLTMPPSAKAVGEKIKDINGAGQARSLTGHERVSVIQSSVSADTQINITDFPAYLKKCHGYSFKANFSTFTKLIIGQGYHQNLGRWFEIDDTDISVVAKADGTERVVGTVQHGLTFRDQINISLMIGDTGSAHVIITTIPDPSDPTVCKYTRDFNFGEQVEGTYFAVGSQAMTNVVFSAVAPDLRKSLWIFGDSYLSIYDNRVGGQLKNYGYFKNILIDAYPGNNSADQYADLTKAIALGKPRFLLWCLGMNDDSADDYEEVMDDVKAICEANEITLILYKVPTVASKKTVLEAINTIVLGSNLRYIDAYRAVETDSDGNWANGTLTPNDIHPTELGAQLIAQQYLMDVPEIMEFPD